MGSFSFFQESRINVHFDIFLFRFSRHVNHLPGVVDVVHEVLDDSRGVGGLDGFGVVGNDHARHGLDGDNTFLAL